MKRAGRIAFSGLAVVLLAGTAKPAGAVTLDEPTCVLESLPQSVRQAFIDAAVTADRERVRTAFEDNATSLASAIDTCREKFQWPMDVRESVFRTFEFDLRAKASVVRLKANGLSEEAAGQMFSSLPVALYPALFGQRPMTEAEMSQLRAKFEPMVDRLDGADGKALSEYLTARAGFAYYSQELQSH